MNADFEPPKLSAWPFVLSDAVLLGTAAVIVSEAQHPFGPTVVWTVGALVGLGAVSMAIPFVVNYTRKLDLALAERQKEIAALAETTAESAARIGVVVAGLQQVIEAANRATKAAEHLPTRLQERVNELKEHLNEVAVNENEALAQELATLRGAETERLEAAVERIQNLVTELRAVDVGKLGETGEAAKGSHEGGSTGSPQDAKERSERGGEGSHEDTKTRRGVTRVLVTAYIGIGNKLFLRGEGAGLEPGRGVPLEFVSIGKWRWESAEAEGPVTFQLFKNDQQPASNIGALTVEPGRQLEVHALF